MPVVLEGLKVCSKCRTPKQSTKEFFYANRAQPDGLDNYCKVCGAEARAKSAHENPAAKRRACAKHRAANPEYHSKRMADWRQKNAKHVAAYNQGRRAIRDKLPGRGVPFKVWLQIVVAWGERCAYCTKGGPDTMDHVVPIVARGAHDPLNVVPACTWCNASKGSKPLEQWFAGSVPELARRIHEISATLQPDARGSRRANYGMPPPDTYLAL